MAIVVKCDLCGGEKGVCDGGRVQIQDFPITRNISESMMYMEVCPECLKAIKQAIGSMLVKKIISGGTQNDKECKKVCCWNDDHSGATFKSNRCKG